MGKLIRKLTRRKYIGTDGDVVTTYYCGGFWHSIGPGIFIYRFCSRKSMKETLELNGYKLYKPHK